MRGYSTSLKEHYNANATIPLLKAHTARFYQDPKVKAFLESDKCTKMEAPDASPTAQAPQVQLNSFMWKRTETKWNEQICIILIFLSFWRRNLSCKPSEQHQGHKRAHGNRRRKCSQKKRQIANDRNQKFQCTKKVSSKRCKAQMKPIMLGRNHCKFMSIPDF